MDGFSTQKRAIFGRIFNSTAYIYMWVVPSGTMWEFWLPGKSQKT